MWLNVAVHVPSTTSASILVNAENGPTAAEAVIGAAIHHLQHAPTHWIQCI